MKKSKEGLVLLILGVVALAGLLYMGSRGVGDGDATSAPSSDGEAARRSR